MRRSHDGRWITSCALRQRKVSGWAIEIDATGPLAEQAAESSGSKADWLAHGRVHNIRWWTWSVPGHTPALSLVDGPHSALLDGRIDDRESIASAVGCSRRDSDAAIVLAAYRRWGIEGLGKLVGELSFAILDADSQEAHLGVDPGGVGEVAWWQPIHGALVASSDPGALLQLAPCLTLDRESAILHLRGTGPPAGRTIFAAVGYVPPFHVASSGGGPPRLHGHRPSVIEPEQMILSLEDASEALAAALKEAVHDRFRSGPGVLLLSGGVDSGSVAAAAANAPGPGLIGSIGFASDIPGVDERACSGALVEHVGLPHHPLEAERWLPYAPCAQIEASPAYDWATRPGAPGPLDPFRLSFGELIDGAYQMASDLGAKVVWGGDRGDLVVGERNRSAFRYLVDGLRAGDSRLARIGASDLLVDFRHRGWRSLADHARPVWRRLRPRAGVPVSAIQLLPDVPQPIGETSVSEFDPTMWRWSLWRSPFVDRIFAASSHLARRRGLRISDPWSDIRVVEVARRVSPSLIDPPGAAGKQLGRATVARLLSVPSWTFHRNGIEALWTAAVRGSGADTLRSLAGEPWLETFGIDIATLQRETERYIRGEERRTFPHMQAWELAWWYRAYGSRLCDPMA